MKVVKVVKEFKWAPDGINVRVVEVGEQFAADSEGAKVTLQMKCGEETDGKPPLRLPPLDEYVKAGYDAKTYDKFIEDRTAEAKAEGVEAFVAPDPTAELEEKEEPAEEEVKQVTEAPENKARKAAPENKARRGK